MFGVAASSRTVASRKSIDPFHSRSPAAVVYQEIPCVAVAQGPE